MVKMSIFDAPIINSEDDIIACIAKLDTGDDGMLLDVPFDGLNENETRVTYRIKAEIHQKSKREILQDGFDIIKTRMNSVQSIPTMINGRKAQPASVIVNDSLKWLDDLIERWLGARREGLNIIWNIGNTIYKYDFYDNKLFKE